MGNVDFRISIYCFINHIFVAKFSLYCVLYLTIFVSGESGMRKMCDQLKAALGLIGICVVFAVMGYVGYLILMK